MQTIKYFYRPLEFYRGKVLKCDGIATDDNRAWFVEQNPGTIIVDGYRGDKIISEAKQ